MLIKNNHFNLQKKTIINICLKNKLFKNLYFQKIDSLLLLSKITQPLYKDFKKLLS
jgi:hypothetical protein